MAGMPIDNATLAEIAATNTHGEALRPGDSVGIWDEGEFPYGRPDACPFCKREQNYTKFWYNGPGHPPSYAFECDHCGAQGPTSYGAGRGDHYGARMQAISLWNCGVGEVKEDVQQEPPAGYLWLEPGQQCKCPRSWTDGNGRFACCLGPRARSARLLEQLRREGLL